MTAITLPNSDLSAGYLDGEAGWGPAMNRNLRILDALVNMRVAYRGLTTPPTGAVSGSLYIVGASATGAWAGKDNQLAIWMQGDDVVSGWAFVLPKEGWRAYVVDESSDYVYNGTAWTIVVVSAGATLRNTVGVLTGSGTVTVDLTSTDYFTLTLSGNVTTLSFVGLPGAGKAASVMIKLTQGSASYTVSWPSSFKWSGTVPVISTGAGIIDILGLTTFDNGTTWMATLSKGHA